jgi:hypothetical protein
MEGAPYRRLRILRTARAVIAQLGTQTATTGTLLLSNFMQERRPRGACISMRIDFIPVEGADRR